MANPQFPLGSLNRLVASVNFIQNTALNVTPPFLTRRSIRFSPDMDVTTFINVLTGMVTSPEPYVGVTVTINLNRTLPLALLWQRQWLIDSRLGDAVVRPDVQANSGGLQPLPLSNVGILRIGELGMDGEDPVLSIALRGTYVVNNALWNAA